MVRRIHACQLIAYVLCSVSFGLPSLKAKASILYPALSSLKFRMKGALTVSGYSDMEEKQGYHDCDADFLLL